MMAQMTTFIATRPVLTHGLKQGNEIVLIHPMDDGENNRFGLFRDINRI